MIWLFTKHIYTYIWLQMYDVNLWCLRTMDGPVFVIHDICMALFCVLSDNFSPTSIWNRKSQVESWKPTRKIPCNMKSWLVKNKSLHFLGEISEKKKQGWYHALQTYTGCLEELHSSCSWNSRSNPSQDHIESTGLNYMTLPTLEQGHLDPGISPKGKNYQVSQWPPVYTFEISS